MAKDAITTTAQSRVEAFHQQMRERATMRDDERSEQVMLSQAERIFDAVEAGKSVDDILNADMGGTIQGRDVPGTVWELRGFDVVQSNRTDLENANGYYLSFNATYLGGPKDIATKNALIIGESYALQTGADLAVFKARALEAADAFPCVVSVVGIKTGAGRQVIKLGPPPENATPGDIA